MSSKARRKAEKRTDLDDSVWNVKTIAVLLAVLACLSLFILGVSKLKQSPVAALPQEFEGKIVDKWAGFSETQEGSYPYFRLLVDVPGHARLTVPVNREMYSEAQKGMGLKRSAKGLELIREPTANSTIR